MNDRPTSLAVLEGDITTIEVDAIVNAANSSLQGGGGVDGAIHRAGGPSILEACLAITAARGPCPPGDAVATGAGELPAGLVFHTVGPIWRGGGKTFAASNRDFSQKVNRKMYRGALQCIVSELVRQERLVVVDEFSVDAPKTKAVAAKLKDLQLSNVLIVTDNVDENLFLGSRNLPKVDVRDAQGVDPVSLIAFEKVLITVPALKKLEEALA